MPKKPLRAGSSNSAGQSGCWTEKAHKPEAKRNFELLDEFDWVSTYKIFEHQIVEHETLYDATQVVRQEEQNEEIDHALERNVLVVQERYSMLIMWLYSQWQAQVLKLLPRVFLSSTAEERGFRDGVDMTKVHLQLRR